LQGPVVHLARAGLAAEMLGQPICALPETPPAFRAPHLVVFAQPVEQVADGCASRLGHVPLAPFLGSQFRPQHPVRHAGIAALGRLPALAPLAVIPLNPKNALPAARPDSPLAPRLRLLLLTHACLPSVARVARPMRRAPGAPAPSTPALRG